MKINKKDIILDVKMISFLFKLLEGESFYVKMISNKH